MTYNKKVARKYVYSINVTRETQNADGSWNCDERDVKVQYHPAQPAIRYDRPGFQICDASADDVDIIDDAGFDLTDDEIEKLREDASILCQKDAEDAAGECNDSDDDERWHYWYKSISDDETNYGLDED